MTQVVAVQHEYRKLGGSASSTSSAYHSQLTRVPDGAARSARSSAGPRVTPTVPDGHCGTTGMPGRDDHAQSRP